MRQGLAALPNLVETVRRHGLRADKGLGQHFLLDANLTDKIARLCDLGGDSPPHILEVGPGPGGLTRSLLAAGAAHVTAVEMDARFLPALREIAEATQRLTIVQGDALELAPKLSHKLPEGYVIAANLPYNVGTRLLITWLTQRPRRWSQMVLMFQLEVAERVVALPGTSAYGRLAVLAQSVADAHIAFTLPAHAFSPPPKVDSAVVVLRPLAATYAHLDILGQLTRAAFGQRRKMLRSALKAFAKSRGLDATAWLEGVGVDPTARAETLGVQQFQELAESLDSQAGE